RANDSEKGIIRRPDTNILERDFLENGNIRRDNSLSCYKHFAVFEEGFHWQDLSTNLASKVGAGGAVGVASGRKSRSRYPL
ncbi:MAG: hypothetical protein L0Y58_21865, partial [Verrucomicrobia subdivision 3 bacterium]|nr:hypothetical protein [Limisphaerales bacterium]